MLLPRFLVHRPASVGEALALKSDLGDDAAFYAGGTELLLVMKLGLAEYGHLIDLKQIAELSELTVEDGTVSVGALVTHDRVSSDSGVAAAFPELAGMAKRIGNSRVRSAGTVGGNLAFGDPHSDPATFLTALGGVVHLTDASGSDRAVNAAEFTLAPYMTVLEEGEMIRSVEIPLPASGTTVVHRHLRFRERPALTITVAVGDGQSAAAVAVGSVVPVPVRLGSVEALVTGASGDAGHDEIKEAAAASIDPTDDLDGTAEYKRALAAEMVARAVTDALKLRRGPTWN